MAIITRIGFWLHCRRHNPPMAGCGDAGGAASGLPQGSETVLHGHRLPAKSEQGHRRDQDQQARAHALAVAARAQHQNAQRNCSQPSACAPYAASRQLSRLVASPLGVSGPLAARFQSLMLAFGCAGEQIGGLVGDPC